VTSSAVVVVLDGPKAAGKSQAAHVLQTEHGVDDIDADLRVLRLLDAGISPHPQDGWLTHIVEEVWAALDNHHAESVEATGAWDSDWQLADDLEAAGVRVLRVWISAPLGVTLDRLAGRATRRAPVTAEEARWIWTAATEQSSRRRFDLVLDTGHVDQREIRDALRPLIPLLPRRR
jgi:hypothetical protein